MTTHANNRIVLESLRDALLADPSTGDVKVAVCAVAICCDRALATLPAAQPTATLWTLPEHGPLCLGHPKAEAQPAPTTLGACPTCGKVA